MTSEFLGKVNNMHIPPPRYAYSTYTCTMHTFKNEKNLLLLLLLLLSLSLSSKLSSSGIALLYSFPRVILRQTEVTITASSRPDCMC